MKKKDYYKYIIEFYLNDNSYVTLWGADMTDNEKDKFLIDADSNILLFKRFIELKGYILNPDNIVFDSLLTREWVLSNEGNNYNPFYTIDINEIRKILSFNVEELFNTVHTNKLVDFLNLFGDYAYQINNKMLISLFKERTIQFILDYNYDIDFWKSNNKRIYKLKSEIKYFDLSRFRKISSKIVIEFISRMKII